MLRVTVWTRFAFAVAVVCAAAGTARAVGLEQSPIDIITADVVGDPHFKPIVFNYSSSVALDVVNINSGTENGTIRGVPGVGSTLTYNSYVYDLKQFHFHIDSEHAINGQKAPMEIHFVNQKQGSSGTNDLLVVGRFVEVGPANTVLDPFFSAITYIPNNNDTYSLSNFDVGSLAPIGQPEYRYDGSLTTPPYTEGVDWNVFYGTPLYLSQAQIDEFAAVFPDGNARALQVLNGRIVTTAAVPEIDAASLGSVVTLLAGAMALLERRRGRRSSSAIAA